jgi:hypothetical protein
MSPELVEEAAAGAWSRRVLVAEEPVEGITVVENGSSHGGGPVHVLL